MFEAFELGPFIFWTRLLFLLLGVWLSAEFFFRLAESANLSLQHFRDYALWYLLAFVLGGRLVSILAQYPVYFHDPLRMFILWDGGFNFLGAAIGISVVLFFVTRQQRTTFLHWLDVLLPATTLGLVFSWLGAFVSGSAYGKPTDIFWGIVYDFPSVRYAVPIHPVQLYYALFYLVLTFLLLVIRKRAKRVGAETLFGIIIAAAGTFFLEYFRGDFTIPVFATRMDFFILLLLFLSLGIFAAVELRLSNRGTFFYEAFLLVFAGSYTMLRPWLPFEPLELRFSQLLTIVALLATIVYVVVHRSKYPHL